MKEISRTKIEREIKEAYAQGKDWCEYGWGRYYKIMIDLDDADIWCDAFLSGNDWKRYHRDAIVSLQCYSWDLVSGYINDAVYQLRRAGWTIK